MSEIRGESQTGGGITKGQSFDQWFSGFKKLAAEIREMTEKERKEEQGQWKEKSSNDY